MAERLVGPISLEAILKTNPPKRETFETVNRGVRYTIESKVVRLGGSDGEKGQIVYVVPGSTRYVGEAPPKAKSEGV